MYRCTRWDTAFFRNKFSLYFFDRGAYVFIRNEIPISMSVPTILSRSNSIIQQECAIKQLKSTNQPIRSSDLEKAVSTSNKYQRLSLPLGHNAICAFSRGSVSTIVNSGGRPVMDSLAIDLTNEISMWRLELIDWLQNVLELRYCYCLCKKRTLYCYANPKEHLAKNNIIAQFHFMMTFHPVYYTVPGDID